MLCNAASVTASCGMLSQFVGTAVVALLVAIAFDCGDEHEDARAASCYEFCDPHATATCAASPTAPKCVCDGGYYGDGIKCWPDGRPAPVDLNDQALRETDAAGMQWCVEAGSITVQIVGVLGSLMLLSATPLVSCHADGCSGCVAGGAPLSRERAQTSWKVYAFSVVVGAGCAVLEYFRIAVPMLFAIVALLGLQLSFGMMCWSRLFQGRIDPALTASYPQQFAAPMAGTSTPPLTPPAPPGSDYGQISSDVAGRSPRMLLAAGSDHPAQDSLACNDGHMPPVSAGSGQDGGSAVEHGHVLSSLHIQSEATDSVSTCGEGVLTPTFPAPPALAPRQPAEESSITRPTRRRIVPASVFPETATERSLVAEQLVQLRHGGREQDGRAVGDADQMSPEP